MYVKQFVITFLIDLIISAIIAEMVDGYFGDFVLVELPYDQAISTDVYKPLFRGSIPAN